VAEQKEKQTALPMIRVKGVVVLLDISRNSFFH
jgi:hypothetical protein